MHGSCSKRDVNYPKKARKHTFLLILTVKIGYIIILEIDSACHFLTKDTYIYVQVCFRGENASPIIAILIYMPPYHLQRQLINIWMCSKIYTKNITHSHTLPSSKSGKNCVETEDLRLDIEDKHTLILTVLCSAVYLGV